MCRYFAASSLVSPPQRWSRVGGIPPPSLVAQPGVELGDDHATVPQQLLQGGQATTPFQVAASKRVPGLAHVETLDSRALADATYDGAGREVACWPVAA